MLCRRSLSQDQLRSLCEKTFHDTQNLHGALTVVLELQNHGFPACIVGGAARDLLLGRTPKEYDLATAAVPDQITDVAFSQHWGVIPVGKAFGVVRVRFQGFEYEVATFRSEGRYTDSRHPDLSTLSFGTSLEDDVARRDFTMNGLALNVTEFGAEIVDYVGGMYDIERRIIRSIGDPVARFTEDALRPLRALRFAAVLGFEIEAATMQAIKDLAPGVSLVSAERILKELCGAVESERAHLAAGLLLETGFLGLLFSTCLALSPDWQPRFLELMQRRSGRGSMPYFLAALASAQGGLRTAVHARKILDVHCETLKVSRALRTAAEDTLEIASALSGFDGTERPSARIRLYRSPAFPDALELSLAHPENRHEERLGLLERVQTERKNTSPLLLSARLPLDGNDLKARGVTPGPAFKTILQELENRMLEGVITDRNSALAELEELLKG